MSHPLTRMVAALKADDAVKAIIGTKLYPLLVPQSVVVPYIVYTFTDISTNAGDGPTGTRQGIVHFVFVATGSPSGYGQLRSLATAVEAALAGADSAGCIWQPQEAVDTPGPLAAGEDILDVQTIEQDYMVWYTSD